LRSLNLSSKATESAHQIAIFDYVSIAKIHGFDKADKYKATRRIPKKDSNQFTTNALPMLEWLHAIPNGGSRGDSPRSRMIRGGQLKAEGVKAGVYDMFLPFPANGYSGLYMELKTPEKKAKTSRGSGGVSVEQKAFGNYAAHAGYKAVVVYGCDEAIEALKEYLSDIG
jgi:hypothetical protein